MVHRLFHATALALGLAGAGFLGTAAGQDSTTVPAVQQPTSNEELNTMPAPAGEDVGTVETPVAPPPDDVVIEAQEPTQDRAEQLIGMTVKGANEETIGSAEDLLIDDRKEVMGVVISVGGFLGIGSKSVAVNWDEVAVRENPETGSSEMVVNWTKEQLEAAPAFKTTEDQEAEAAAIQMQQDLAPPPAPSIGVTTE